MNIHFVNCSEKGMECHLESNITCPGKCVFKQIGDLFPVGMVALKLSTRECLFVNKPAKHLLGARLREFLTHIFESSLDILHNFDDESFSGDYRIGNSTIGYTVYKFSRNIVLVQFRDITDRKANKDMRQQKEICEEYNMVIAEIIHEVGNPLAGIKATLEVMTDNFELYSDSKKINFVTNCISEIRRLENLLKQLRPLASDTYVRMELFNLRDELEMISSLALCEFSNTMHISLDIPNSLYISADRNGFAQIIDNLVNNSIDAMDGEGLIELKAYEMERNFVCLDFKDTGPGVSEDNLSKIFRPFFTTKKTGLGVGLAVTRKIMLKMEGNIKALQSDTGAHFRLYFSKPGGQS